MLDRQCPEVSIADEVAADARCVEQLAQHGVVTAVGCGTETLDRLIHDSTMSMARFGFSGRTITRGLVTSRTNPTVTEVGRPIVELEAMAVSSHDRAES